MINCATAHKQSFDREYLKHREMIDIYKNVRFPLKDIHLLHADKQPQEERMYSYYYRSFQSHIIDLLQMKNSFSVLNIGCGFGFLEKNLFNLYKFLDLWSIDISDYWVRSIQSSKGNFGFNIQEREDYFNYEEKEDYRAK